MSSDLTRNTLYLTLASVGQKLVAFVYFLFLARIMQPERTGTYFLAVSIAMVFSAIADMGITPVVIRELAKFPDQIESIFRRAFALKLPFLLLGYLCSVGAALFLGYTHEVVLLTAVSGLSLVLDSVHLLFYGVLRSQQQLKFEAMGLFTGQVLVALIGGFILWLAPSLYLLLFALVVGSCFNVGMSGSILLKRYGTILFKPIWDLSYVKKFVRLALPFALAAIFVKVYSYIDTIFLSKFLDITAVGLYSIAYKFTYAFQFLPLAFVAALYPKFSWSLEHQPDAMPILLRRALWYMAILVTPLVLGMWLIAEPAVLLVGNSYLAAAPILSILVFALVPIFLDFPIGSLLNASGRQTIKTTIMGLTMMVNVVANAILIPKFAALGASYAAIISFSFMFVSGFLFVPKMVPAFQMRLFFFDLLKIGISGMIMVLVGMIILPLIGWMATVPVCGFIYLLALFSTRALSKNDVYLLKHFRRV